MLEDHRIHSLGHLHRLREIMQSLVVPDDVAIPVCEDVGPRGEDELPPAVPA